MKRETSWAAAVLLAVAAFFGFSQRSESPSTAVNPATASPHKPTPVPANKNTKKGTQQPGFEPCQGIDNLLRAFYPVDDLNRPTTDFVIPTVCGNGELAPYERQSIVRSELLGTTVAKEQDKLWNKTRSTKFIIATLPDPEKTHLTLIFDRLIVAIQRAAQDECLTYDSSWLPWRSHDSAYTGLGDQEEAEEDHEAELLQPGILLFRENRRSDCMDKILQPLIIFVVGEAPTGGIDKEQFLSAISWIQSLSDTAADPSKPFTLNILGPYSSGSFDSLEKTVDLLPHKGPLYIDISTGTTTGDKMIDNFQHSSVSISSFADFVEKDEAATHGFLCSLHENGYDVGKVATFSEDETAYGASVTTKEVGSSCYGIFPGLHLVYPRNISSLRSEYEKSSLLSPSSAAESKAAVLRVLPTTILGEEETNQSDTVAGYSGKQEPLSEEAEVLETVDVLRAKHIEFILLSGSNPMDTIFLAQFLRRAYPEGKVVLSGSDALLFRGRGQDSLDGVLTLSVYPLISEMQDWTNGPQQAHAGFTNDAAEGEYNAARHLMHTVLGHAHHPFALPNYATPDWLFDNPLSHPDRDIPPVWLSIISANRAWPVEAYPAIDLKHSLLHASRFDQPQPALVESNRQSLRYQKWLRQEHFDRGEAPIPRSLPPVCTEDFPTGFIPLAFTPLCFALWYWYRCISRPDIIGPRQHTFIALAWFCIAAMAIVPAIFSGLPWELFHEACASRWLLIRGLLPMICAVLIAIVFPLVHLIVRLDLYVDAIRINKAVVRRGLSFLDRLAVLRKSKRLFLIASLPALLSIGAGLWAWLLLMGLTPAHRELMFWRGLSLLSGVSPSAPVVAFAIGGFVWCIKSQNAVRLLRVDRPRLPQKGYLDAPLRILSEERYERLKSTGPHATWPVRLGLLTAIAIAICLVNYYLELPYGHLRTLEPMSFTRSYEVLFWLAATLVLSEAILVRVAWMTLRPLLSALSALPLRRTLISLQEIRWKTLWSVGDRGSCRRFLARLWEASSHLSASLSQDCPALDRHDVIFAACKSIDDCFHELHQNRTSTAEDSCSLESVTLASRMQQECAAAAAFLLQELLMPAWKKETGSLIIPKDAKSAQDGPAPPPLSACECVRNAEEFVCLVYLAFIQNVLARFRFLVVGTLAIFLSTVAAAAVLAFDPRPAMSAALLLLFLAFASAIVSVFWQMHRNETLSYITNTKPGELGAEFWVHAIAFATGPVLALIAIAFPELSSWLFSFLQPGSS
jgi:hypothetical protein